MTEIEIVDVKIPFWSVVKLVLKFKAATILLLIALLVVYFGLTVLFGTPLGGPKHTVLSGFFF